MRKFFAVTFCMIFVVVGFSAQPSLFAQAVDPALVMQGASLTQRDGLYILHLKGSPYQMGYQQGYLLREKINYLYKHYLVSWLKEKTGRGLKFWVAFRVFNRSAVKMERYIPEEYRQEMKGIAAGSGLSYRQVLIMHTFLDVVSNPKIVRKPVLSCTNFMTLNKASAGSALIHGRNLSWPSKGLLDKNSTIVFYEPDKGNKFTAFSWPGICGVLTGMNEKGVTVGETSVGSAESTLDGVPAFILFRDALQYSDSIYDVIRNVGSHPRTTGYTLGVADGRLKRACVIECTGTRYSVRFPKDDFLICANHYLDSALFETMKPVYPGRELSDTNTYQRMVRIEQLIRKNFGRVDGKMAESFLSDPVMATPGTFLSVVFQPESLGFSVAIGHENIRRGKFFAFDLKAELNLKPELKTVYQNPENTFSYEKKEITEKRTLVDQSGGRRKYDVLMPMGAKSEYLDSNVYLTYFEPKGKTNFPVVIILPHFTGSKSAIEDKFAEQFTRAGMGAVIVDMAFQKQGRSWLRKQMRSGDLSVLENLFRQIIIEARRTIDWLETQPGVDSSRIGVMGISLGAIAAPIVSGNDPRVKAAAYVLGGGDLSTILFNDGEVAFFKKRMDAAKISAMDFRTRFSAIDPLTYAFKAKDVPSVMFNAMNDRLIPKKSTMQLWNALEYPKMIMYPGGHYTSILFLADVRNRVCDHFKSFFAAAVVP